MVIRFMALSFLHTLVSPLASLCRLLYKPIVFLLYTDEPYITGKE